MKKRIKSRISPSANKKKKVNIPVLIFVLALVFVVYSGAMGLLDKSLTSPNNQITNSGDLASYSNPANMILAGIIIIIFFIIVIIFLNVKVKKKRR